MDLYTRPSKIAGSALDGRQLARVLWRHFADNKIDIGRIKATATVVLAAVALAGCTPDAEEENLQIIRTRAEQFLSLLRAQEWHEAAEMVLLNDSAYYRFNIADQRDPAALRKEIVKLFTRVYSNVIPGDLVSVRLNPEDPTLASIAYRHDDLDGFNMRLFDGQWYYSFE